jgi:hypothetical protein
MLAKITEERQLWTVRLKLSLIQPVVLSLWTLAASTTLAALTSEISATVGTILGEVTQLFGINSSNYSIISLRSWLSSVVLLLGVGRSIQHVATTKYLQLRWLAWSGPSRTGIPPEIAIHIGKAAQWGTLDALSEKIPRHPVERFARLLSLDFTTIECDPTDLLRFKSTQLMPSERSELLKDGVYQPSSTETSVSLLWGENLGFCRRCSRGVIAIPPYLTKASPKLRNGLDAKAICLAFGIVARNKGLDPATMVCNLKKKGAFRLWEEGALWPHPAKTLRGYYYAEVNEAFHLLGEPFVVAVTELALLLADIKSSLLAMWLERILEHQDLALNRLVYDLGARAGDLQRLYRGQYAAMLISLALFHPGVCIRPELAVFEAVCKFEGAPLPSWLSAEELRERKEEEVRSYGSSLRRMIEAII